MALQYLPGCNNQWLWDWPAVAFPPTLTNIGVDAAADRVTFIGGFEHQDRTTKTITGVEFLFGTVVKTNGSTFQASLQDVSLSAGPVAREDGTPDQTMTIANADAGFVTDAWYGGNFDAAATRTLAPGELVAVVLQFASFVAGDSLNIRALTRQGYIAGQGFTSANLTGSVAAQTVFSNVILRCSDGSFGTLTGAWPLSALNAHTYAVGTAVADEYAMAVQFPFPCQIGGIWCPATFGTTTQATEVLLYSGTTPLATVTIDHNAVASSLNWPYYSTFAPQTLTANTLYRAAVRPTGAATITIYSTDLTNANHLSCLPGGTAFHLWTRLDQGAWGGQLTTRRLFAGVRLASFDDGAGGGGGGVIARSLIAGGG